jgi:hemerythrin-like domain-containing protein
MAVQIGAKPDSGFDDPLGMLKDCHRRIERFLLILCHVADRAGAGPLTAEERDAVEAATQYFRVGGQRHNQDEEESLFPRLRSATPRLFEAMDRLEQDHRQAGELHALVDRLLSAWIATGAISPQGQQELRNAAQRLERLYAEHIGIEETAIFPSAARLLDGEALAKIGAEFRARRI